MSYYIVFEGNRDLHAVGKAQGHGGHRNRSEASQVLADFLIWGGFTVFIGKKRILIIPASRRCWEDLVTYFCKPLASHIVGAQHQTIS